jgi:hypothetical protein
MASAAPGPLDVDPGAPAPTPAPAAPVRRRRRRWPPTLAFVLGAAFAVWAASVGLASISDNSFMTHLATGRLIVGGGGIPTHDPYSFTARGQPWVVQSWLASVLYGWVDRFWGGQGLRVLMGLTTGALGAMTWRLTRPAKSLVGRIVIAGLVVGVGTAVWSPRPLLIGLLMLTVALLAAEGGLPPWVLVPAFWIWVNTHGSFPLGLAALGALWLGRLADQRDASVERRCLLWGIGGTVLGAVSPLGPALLVFPVHLLGKMKVLSNIIEWQSPSFSSGWARLFLLQVVIAVLLLVRKPSYRAAIPLVVFVAAALIGERNVSVAALVMVPGMARGFSGIGSLRGEQRNPVTLVALAAVVLVGALMVSVSLGNPAWSLGDFPVAPLAWMHQQGIAPGDVRMATSDTTGNYLELLYGTRAHAFLDDRVDMYPAAVVDDFLTLEHATPGWSQVLARRNIDVVLWERSLPLTQLLSDSGAWRVLYQDKTWSLMCRRGSVLAPGQTC